jgi:hypothetical protein
LTVPDERTVMRGAGILEGVQAHKDRVPYGGSSMAQLIPSLTTLIASFRDCFHLQVF